MGYPERVEQLILGCTACGGFQRRACRRQGFAGADGARHHDSEEGAEAMVPYIYDASTPRERIDQDLAVRRTVYPTTEGYMGQVQGIIA